MAENGGRVIDITKPPFNARGDGVTDNTTAFRMAFTMVRDLIVAHGGLKENHDTYNDLDIAKNLIFQFYIPNGTYLVSDTVTYDGSLGWGLAFMRFIGQERSRTIIKLADRSAGYAAGAQKPVMTFIKPNTLGNSHSKRGFSNVAYHLQVRNLTINTGVGNPGAVGLVFHGANSSRLHDLTIKSEDGAGDTGILFPLGSVQGHYKDITVDGFDYGLQLTEPIESYPTLEYLSVRNFKKAGINIQGSGVSIRKFHATCTTGIAPAIEIGTDRSQVVIIDSQLEGVGGPAIDLKNPGSHLFARNLRALGYSSSIRKGNVDSASGPVEEYNSMATYALFPARQEMRSMNLPIEDAPYVPWEQDIREWANVEDYPGTTREKVQAALNSGKSTVYFPKSSYYVGTVTVPATVKVITGLFTTISPAGTSTFVVNGESSAPLLIGQFRGFMEIQLRCSRTVIFEDGSGYIRNAQSEPVKVFLESVNNVGSKADFCTPKQAIWARSVNTESASSCFKIYGGRCWVLGYKTEQPTSSFEVTSGGMCEVLGGYRNETGSTSGAPQVVNRDSHVSYVGFSGNYGVFQEAVKDIKGATEKSLDRTDVPARPGGNPVPDFFIPLYVSYERGAIPTAQATPETAAPPSQLANLSVRANAGSASQTLIVGFVVAGLGNKPLLVRGIGPSLAAFGVTGVAADPQLYLYQGEVLVAANDNWGASESVIRITESAHQVGAFALADSRSLDAALYALLSPRGYTAQLIANGPGGVALVELYDGDTAMPSRLVNVSARCLVGTGDRALMAGFFIKGVRTKSVLIRAVGPTLGTLGVTDYLPDPQLALLRGETLVQTNEDWFRDGGAQSLPPVFAAIGAFPLSTQSRDAALLLSLSPGAYTARVTGAASTTGVALIEIYEVP